ncbi:hypothetical protein RHMOL_Rhmol06G0180100 [Rhododendron molle]|uniref:Uncharacterized protein n=1 Tax=Rhododendron molle TaxID=49168 RepID=A0ACC0NDN5_RHOML|nr:hypothetical protein RHMOL_Rhmol06G0180100 [Rhododendron molle]
MVEEEAVGDIRGAAAKGYKTKNPKPTKQKQFSADRCIFGMDQDIGGVREDGPRILKSLAGIDTHLMIVLLSHSISSDCPNRSNRIHSHAQPASFFAFSAADAIADAIELLADAAAAAARAVISIAAACGGSADYFTRPRLAVRRKEKGPFPSPYGHILSLSLSLSLCNAIGFCDYSLSGFLSGYSIFVTSSSSAIDPHGMFYLTKQAKISMMPSLVLTHHAFN